MSRARIAMAALSLSAAAFVGRAVHEGYTEGAVIPVKGDVPTYGLGMTTRPDGTPVRLGDRTNPIEAMQRSLAYSQKASAQIKRCVTADLHQEEFDLMDDFSYQYGTKTLCASQIVARANAGDYRGSCEAYKDFRKVRAAPGERFGPGMSMSEDGVMRYDCSTLIDGKPNKRCYGVWRRQLERHDRCMAVQ